MDKVLLRGMLQTIKNNFAMAQMGIALMTDEDAPQRFENILKLLKDHPETASFAYIRYVFESDELLKHTTNEFRNSVLRNCLKETFELVKLYGDETNQAHLVKAALWYQFLRIVRNCLSHDLQIQFTDHDLKKLPVHWNGLTIECAMQNKPLPMRDFLSRPKVIELMDAVIEHMEQHVD